LLVALVVARGSLDPRYQVENSSLDFRGLDRALLVVNQAVLGVTLLTVMVAAASLVVRFRRAHGMERQQLRWVAWAAVLVVLAAVIALASAALGLPETLGWATGICVALLPLAIGAAILRYRLYDLDRILSRTLTWGLLTVLLGGGYAVVVLGLGQLLGRDSSLVVAGATLAVAALFQPARRRVQAVVDRRFNRRRHDATRIVEGFGARLRDQVDLDTLTTDLLAVVEETMQPTQASLWLRSPPEPVTYTPRRPGLAMTPEEPNGVPRGTRTPTARSVAWCSPSIWSAPDQSGLLTSEAPSIWSAPVGSRRIVWMINRMIKERPTETLDGRASRSYSRRGSA
jgi:hypothetical protein